MEEPGRLQSMGSLRVRHDWATSLSLFTFLNWRRKWQPTPVFLPGESPGRGEPDGLPSMGSHRVGHDWSDLAAAAASFFMAQLSHLYMPIGKNIALTIWTLLEKQESFNFMAAVTVHSDFGDQESKVCHCFYFFTLLFAMCDGTRWNDLSFFFFFNIEFQVSFFTLLFHPHWEAL